MSCSRRRLPRGGTPRRAHAVRVPTTAAHWRPPRRSSTSASWTWLLRDTARRRLLADGRVAGKSATCRLTSSRRSASSELSSAARLSGARRSASKSAAVPPPSRRRRRPGCPRRRPRCAASRRPLEARARRGRLMTAVPGGAPSVACLRKPASHAKAGCSVGAELCALLNCLASYVYL